MDDTIARVLGDTAVALAAVRDPDAAFAAAFPEVGALAYPAPPQVEHEVAADGKPLLDHVTRLLDKLAALEAGDVARWQPGLSAAAFATLAATAERVRDAGLLPALRAAILHLDIAKTADPVRRAAWHAQGIALDIHNEAAAAIVRRAERAQTWGLAQPLAELAIAWIAAHGLAGQHVRGEGPIAMLAPLVAALRALPPRVDIARALDAMYVLDASDTAALREWLVDDALLAKHARVPDHHANAPARTDLEPEVALAEPPPDRAQLGDRLCALRAGRQRAGEPAAAVASAVAAIGDTELAARAPALATCQLWYCEAALSALSPSAQLAVIAAAVGEARKHGIDVARPWHAQLQPLVTRLHGDAPATRYRLRLIEAALAARSIRELLTGSAGLGPLGAMSATLSATTAQAPANAVVIDFAASPEADALITLLPIYETRSQAAFHTMLKALCDLYGLRKDDFDRVANEASYLDTMNAARTDKQRMLDFVRPGRIVEIGPGGGVVLDLLEDRFATAEIIGVDLSREVIAALAARAKANGRRWRVVLGAAEKLNELVGDNSVDGQGLPLTGSIAESRCGSIDTVVFCSILHEVFSYTEPHFRLESVRDVIRAAWRVLRPGGRIVIRDGVMPAPGTRRIAFLAPDARPTFELYVAQFAGRKIEFRGLADGRVELSTADAMEFLYTYTWGPASFPYEVRELYGIMTYDAYVASLVDWVGGDARVVDIPLDQRSYLQPGYRTGLAGKIALTDERDVPVELPDSNCLIAIEKS